jgi:hypothetical protein
MTGLWLALWLDHFVLRPQAAERFLRPVFRLFWRSFGTESAALTTFIVTLWQI